MCDFATDSICPKGSSGPFFKKGPNAKNFIIKIALE